jgi:uncharacterized protein (TIRG00374 family)
LAAVALLIFVVRSVSLEEVWHALQRLTPAELVILAAVNGAILVTLAARWWIFLHAQGYTLPYWYLVRYRLTAFSINYFTPGSHFGGEPYQVYAVSAWHGVPYSISIAAVTLDKLLELLVNFAFLTGGILLVLRQQPLAGPLEDQLLVAALLLLLLPMALLAALGLGKHPFSRPIVLFRAWRGHQADDAEPQWLQVIRQSEAQVTLLCRARPRLFALAVIVSVLSWLMLVGEFWLMTAMLDLGMGPWAALTAMVAARLAILLPLPAALGTLEASQMLAASALGLSPAAGVALSLVIRGRDVLVALLGLGLGGADVWRRLWQRSPAVDDVAPLPGHNDPVRAPSARP